MAMASARDRSWPGGELPGKDAHLGMVLTNTPQNPPYGAQLLQGLMGSWASKGVMLKGFWESPQPKGGMKERGLASSEQTKA